jgi:hypothetical protein
MMARARAAFRQVTASMAQEALDLIENLMSVLAKHIALSEVAVTSRNQITLCSNVRPYVDFVRMDSDVMFVDGHGLFVGHWLSFIFKTTVL